MDEHRVNNERIKEIRKKKGLSQEKFGKQLGVTKAAISRMESDVYKATDTMVKLICSEFNINENWLKTGIGKMFTENDATLLGELVSQYKLDELDRRIVESFLKLLPEERKVLKDYVCSIAATKENNIDRQVEDFRKELEAEQKGETLSALQNSKGDVS